MQYINLKIPEHSYFFGFLQTDGTLGKIKGFRNKGRLQIELGAKDAHILKSFKEMFPSIYSGIRTRKRNTNFKNNHKSCALTICDMDFRNEVNKLGIPYGKKSQVVSPPNGKFCERDYIRGLVDGDGSIGITDRGIPFLSFTVKSEMLKNYLLTVIERKVSERKKLRRNGRDGIYNIMLNRERARLFADWLYYPGCLTLKRKLQKARLVLNWRRPKGLRKSPKRFWESWEDKYLLTHSINESCQKLNRTKQSVTMRIWRFQTSRLKVGDIRYL
jgi:hypothetical protein